MPDLQDTLFTEYPELRDIDDRTIADFEELLNLGSETWEINLGGYTFVYGALFEFEERLAFKNTANFDALTRLRLLKIEYLVDSIIAIKTPHGVTYDFLNREQKLQLRTILLSLRPRIINYLYEGYEWGMRNLEAKLKDKLGSVEEVLARGFFETSGRYLSALDLRTPETKDSGE